MLNPEGRPHFEAAALHGVGRLRDAEGDLAAGHRLRPPEGGAGRHLAEGWPRRQPAEPTLEMPTLDVTPPNGLRPEALATAPMPPRGPAPTRKRRSRSSSPRRTTGETGRPPVKTEAPLDIQAELEKLRAITVAAPRPAPPPADSPGRSAIEKRLQDMIGTYGARQDIKRKASIEVPNGLLKGSGTMRVHLAFDGAGPEEIVRDAVDHPARGNQKLERLTLHIDLEVKGQAARERLASSGGRLRPATPSAGGLWPGAFDRRPAPPWRGAVVAGAAAGRRRAPPSPGRRPPRPSGVAELVRLRRRTGGRPAGRARGRRGVLTPLSFGTNDWFMDRRRSTHSSCPRSAALTRIFCMKTSEFAMGIVDAGLVVHGQRSGRAARRRPWSWCPPPGRR